MKSNIKNVDKKCQNCVKSCKQWHEVVYCRIREEVKPKKKNC